MKKKVGRVLKKIRKFILKYISTNRLTLTFILFSMIQTFLIRYVTLNDPWHWMPFAIDFALILVIVAIAYLKKPTKQFNYYFIWTIIISAMCVINSIYYTFYQSFTSFSLLSTLGQVQTVTDSLVEKFRIIDFVYLIFPVLFYIIHRRLKATTYYSFMAKVEKGKKMFISTLLVAVVIIAVSLVNMNGTDYSRITKLWNKQYVVNRFGIILYQTDDLVQSLIPKFNALFGYDSAAKRFKNFYTEQIKENEKKEPNKYTGIFEDMNVIFIHMESMQNFLIDKKINGEEITPTINRLSKEGMYFSNFYPQISVGTSSDTEFTLNTSLMPAQSGTVFVSYYNRKYVAIPNILSDMGYYTFSMHANLASMWNRDKMHPTLGYEDFYSSTSFDISKDTSVGLGLSDEEFYKQAQHILEEIEDEHEHYMGTMIQLSNHSPFYGTPNNPSKYFDYGELDLTNTYTVVDEDTGETETETDDYLEGTKLGNYIISAHYADMALGEFFDYINESPYFENTVFVLYGDHDAKLSNSEFEYYYNYDTKTGKVYDKDDDEYFDFNYYQQEMNRRTPLIFWTKNKSIQKRIKIRNDNVMGMYDVLPTLGNMMNFKSDFALGHDIYDIGEDNVVIFPNTSFVTNKIFYNNLNSSYLSLGTNIELEDGYIDNLKDYVETRLQISNDIIVYDLIRKEADKLYSSLEPDEEVPKE